MRRVIGYRDGKKLWSENQPARGRVAGFSGITLGQALTEVAQVRQPKNEREVPPEVGR